MLEGIVFSQLGLYHLITAILSLIAGTCILLMKKGSRIHKRIGYVYVIAMIGLNGTAFGLYHLFGSFGIFHVAAIISLASVILGMIPVLRRKNKNWVVLHFAWMFWSVFGLYAAFVSELAVRIPSTPFFGMVGIGTAVVMILANIIWFRKKKQWEAEFTAIPA